MKRFERLAFLFTSDIRNRGFVRLDIDEAACLFNAITNLVTLRQPAVNGIEIGRAAGGSTILIASAIDGRLISIDNNPMNDEALQIKLTSNAITNVILVVADSQEVDIHNIFTTNHFAQQTIDFVFIDGDHSYHGAKRDFDNFSPVVKKGGYIIFHDMVKVRNNALMDNRLTQLKNEIIASHLYDIKDYAGSLIVFEKL